MDQSIPQEYDTAFMEKAKAVVPGIHADIVKEKKKTERQVPRYVRRAYKSKDKKRIEEVLARAIYAGFTKDEMLADFKKYESENKVNERG